MTGSSAAFDSRLGEKSLIAAAPWLSALQLLLQEANVGFAVAENNGTYTHRNTIFHGFQLSLSAQQLEAVVTRCRVDGYAQQTLEHWFVIAISLQVFTADGAVVVVACPAKESKFGKEPAVLPWQSIANNTFEFVFFTSPDDKLVFANKLFRQKFEEVLKSKFDVRELFEDSSHYQLLKSKILNEEIIKGVSVFFRSPDGTRLSGLLNGQLLFDENSEPLLNWTVLDVSDRIDFEERMKAKNDQLAKLNYQMEKFVYSTSHDLRSPLTSILGLVNLMRLDFRDRLVLDYAEKIEGSAHKLDKIIRDILSFSRVTYQNARVERVDWHGMITRVINTYQSHPHFSKIHLDITINGDAVIYLDSARLEVILDNLISNAIHFTDLNKHKPFVTIKVECFLHEVILSIHDNGVGIPRQFLDQIFNMFFKANAVSKGAGLGLFLAKESVIHLGGQINVESEPGFGSVFTVSIPNSAKGKLVNRKILLQGRSSGI